MSRISGTPPFIVFLMVAACVNVTPVAWAEQQWGDLKMQFLLPGAPPPPQPIRPAANVPFCAGQGLVDESRLVDPETNGIKNVVVYLYTGAPWFQRPAAVHPELKKEPKTVTLALSGCQFDPRVVLLTAGDTLRVTNADPVDHHFNFNAFTNPAVRIDLAPGAVELLKLDQAEIAPVPVECHIHSWMKGWVVVFDTPYIAKSDEQGILYIKNLPAGAILHFRMFHERAGQNAALQRVDAPPLPLRRNILSVKIEPGANDLGKILLPL